MALFGESRDISMFRHINRELMQNIISQQVVYYKYNLTKTKVNMYGEASEGRYFQDPVLLYALVERSAQSNPVDEFGVEFDYPVTFKFLRDDVQDLQLVIEPGDVIMYNEGYWEVDDTNATQFFVGKDPAYPYTDSTGTNPLETDLSSFGYNVSTICTAHYVPADRLNIIKQRL
jgi:hypothetical protein